MNHLTVLALALWTILSVPTHAQQAAPSIAPDQPAMAAGPQAARADTPALAPASSALPRLTIADNHRFLVTDRGEPFFWLGDTAWWIFRLTDVEIDEYLSVRARQGFTGLQVDLNPYAWRHHWRNVVAPDEFANPFVGYDPSTPDEAYWQRVDRLVDNAGRHGLYLMLTPMWGQFYRHYVGLDAARATRLGKWLGDRYRDRSHVLWFVAGEYDFINGYKPITAVQKALLNAVARGLEEGHGGRQLMTIHPGTMRTSSSDFHDEDWLDFNMLQSGHVADLANEENYQLITRDWERTPSKPVFDGEPAYEDMIDGWFSGPRDGTGDRMGAAVVRRKAYWAVFAGAFGHTYGHNDVQIFWSPGKPLETANRNHWRDALLAPGAEQMRHLRSLITARPMLNLRPDQAVLVSPPGTGLEHARALRATDGSCALVYLPTGRPVTADLTRLAGAEATAAWFDPRSGNRSSIGRYPCTGAHEFAPPSRGIGQASDLLIRVGSILGPFAHLRFESASV